MKCASIIFRLGFVLNLPSPLLSPSWCDYHHQVLERSANFSISIKRNKDGSAKLFSTIDFFVLYSTSSKEEEKISGLGWPATTARHKECVNKFPALLFVFLCKSIKHHPMWASIHFQALASVSGRKSLAMKSFMLVKWSSNEESLPIHQAEFVSIFFY